MDTPGEKNSQKPQSEGKRPKSDKKSKKKKEAVVEEEEEEKVETEEVEIKRTKVAWSDDLSYDSEEEREKERLALAELIAAESPIKPTYPEEDLEKLVVFIKKITTLYDLRETDWNQQCTDTIKEYILDPQVLILSVYFRGDVLAASLDIPLFPVHDLTYFLREPDMVFTLEHFHDEIMFGTFSNTVEGSLLKVLECVYAPYFYSITSWPDSVKSEFCAQIHTFLAKLTDMHHKMLGLTVLYVPREGRSLTAAHAGEDRELVRRLEGVAVYWTHQVKSCITDHASIASRRELLCPSDEYDFWIYRYENLSSVHYQIQKESVKHITSILQATNSTFINQFQTLCEEVVENMAEAKSNIEYLQIIRQPCAELECVTDPDEIGDHIPKIVHLFRFIWKESPFYNSSGRITNLFKALSNQVIILCTNYIDLKGLFGGKTKNAMGQLSKCLDCCRKYKEIYDLISEAHNDNESDSWLLDNGFIFNYIDSFVHRCIDMLDVCNGMIIFGRIDEVETIPKPIFRMQEFEITCEKIENNYKKALSEIEAVQDMILNVQNPSWYDDILKYRAAVKDIEVIIENLADSVFDTVSHVEEAVEALFSMYNYSKRKNLKKIFKRKTAIVWTMLNAEIQDVKNDMVTDRNHHSAELPPYSGRAVLMDMKKSRLIYLKTIVTEAAWMMPCNNSDNVKISVNKLIAAIDMNIRELWISWTHNLDEKCATTLNRNLMCRSQINPGLLECNIDKNILEICREAMHWENLQLDIPTHAFHVYLKHKTIVFVYESVLAVVKGYNKILDSLSDEERLLFKPLITMALRFSYFVIDAVLQVFKSGP